MILWEFTGGFYGGKRRNLDFVRVVADAYRICSKSVVFPFLTESLVSKLYPISSCGWIEGSSRAYLAFLAFGPPGKLSRSVYRMMMEISALLFTVAIWSLFQVKSVLDVKNEWSWENILPLHTVLWLERQVGKRESRRETQNSFCWDRGGSVSRPRETTASYKRWDLATCRNSCRPLSHCSHWNLEDSMERWDNKARASRLGSGATRILKKDFIYKFRIKPTEELRV